MTAQCDALRNALDIQMYATQGHENQTNLITRSPRLSHQRDRLPAGQGGFIHKIATCTDAMPQLLKNDSPGFDRRKRWILGGEMAGDNIGVDELSGQVEFSINR